MLYFLRKELECLHEHSTPDGDGHWICKGSGQVMRAAAVSHSIHDALIPMGGSGMVRRVMHLFCPSCQEGQDAPREGSPVKENELCQADEEFNIVELTEV